MEKKKTVMIVILAALFLLSGFISMADAKARIQLPTPDRTKATKKEVKELKAFYDKIEDAMADENLAAIMNFYSEDYIHRGVNKQQIWSLWSEIFSKFDYLHSIHIFSEINVQGSEAVITCTGVLMGTPRDSKEGAMTTIDNWITQNHWLSKFGGSWKMVGGATQWITKEEHLPRGVIKYNIEFHPLF
jgi:ketosteroid isomerase-like protein